jgi:hypothetical protein
LDGLITVQFIERTYLQQAAPVLQQLEPVPQQGETPPLLQQDEPGVQQEALASQQEVLAFERDANVWSANTVAAPIVATNRLTANRDFAIFIM